MTRLVQLRFTEVEPLSASNLPRDEALRDTLFEGTRRNFIVWLTEDAVVEILNPFTEGRRGTSVFDSVGHGE